MIKFFRTDGAPTVESLQQKKDDILSTFTIMLNNLMVLQNEQNALASDLDTKIAEMIEQKKAITEMSENTTKTIVKISQILE